MKDRARTREDEDHEPLYDPPVTEEDLEPDGPIGTSVIDKHVYINPGRSWPHFRVRGARIGPDEETELGRRHWRAVLEYDHPDYAYRQPEEAYTKEQIEWALTPVDEDDPWEESGGDIDQSLDDIDG